jgi:hypothetical protein
MALKRKAEVLYVCQLSRSYHDKVRPLMDFYCNQYWSGKMSLDLAWQNTKYVVKYSYVFKDVNATDLMCWEIENSETTPHP